MDLTRVLAPARSPRSETYNALEFPATQSYKDPPVFMGTGLRALFDLAARYQVNPIATRTIDELSQSLSEGEKAGRPRLLFLCQLLPYPPDGGAEIRTYNILRLLSREYEVTALCFFRQAMRPTSDQVAAGVAGLSEFVRAEAFPIPQEQSPIRLIRDHVRSLLERRVYTVAAYESRAYRRRLEDLLRTERFDVIHVDSLDLSAYLPQLLEHTRVVCGHHNIESALLRRRAEAERSLLKRWYMRYQAKLMELEERRWGRKVDLNAMVSAGDAEIFRARVPGAATCVVQNGVDTRQFRPAAGPQEGVVFVGNHSWFPNRDAMEYFCAEMLPLLRALHPNVRVKWVGRTPETERARYSSEYGVMLTGYVDDVQDYVHRAACFIVPLRVGGGTRLKILDAWAMGKAVVSTSVGCEGLAARDGENILIADTPEAFAKAIERVLGDEVLRERLGEAARRTAESTYEWDVIGRDLLREYARVSEGARARPNHPSAALAVP